MPQSDLLLPWLDAASTTRRCRCASREASRREARASAEHLFAELGLEGFARAAALARARASSREACASASRSPRTCCSRASRCLVPRWSPSARSDAINAALTCSSGWRARSRASRGTVVLVTHDVERRRCLLADRRDRALAAAGAHRGEPSSRAGAPGRRASDAGVIRAARARLGGAHAGGRYEEGVSRAHSRRALLALRAARRGGKLYATSRAFKSVLLARAARGRERAVAEPWAARAQLRGDPPSRSCSGWRWRSFAASCSRARSTSVPLLRRAFYPLAGWARRRFR